MTPEKLDEARAKEAWRIWNEEDGVTDEGHAVIAARLAREGWTPPEPVVDPDVLAFREWETRVGCSDAYRKAVLEGKWDQSVNARAYLAGARMAREQERERAKVLVDYVEIDTRRLDGVGGRALAVLARYRGEAR